MPSPDCRNLTNFLDDNAQDYWYDSYGEIVPFYDALEEEGEQYYDEDNMIPERYYHQEYGIEILELPDPILEVATYVNVPGNVETDGFNETGDNELSKPIAILRSKFYNV